MTSLTHLDTPEILQELTLSARQLHRRWSKNVSVTYDECVSAINDAAVDLTLRHDPDRGRTLKSYLQAYLQQEGSQRLESWGLIPPRRHATALTEQPFSEDWDEEVLDPNPVVPPSLQHDTKEWLNRCPSLTGMQRAVLWQRYQHNGAAPSGEFTSDEPVSWAEVARRLGITEYVAKAHATEARKVLRAWAKDRGFDRATRNPAVLRKGGPE